MSRLTIDDSTTGAHRPELALGCRPTAPFGRFMRDRRGATAIEFGLLVLPFLGVLTALFEIAYVDFTSEALQSAVTMASRDVLTGTLQANNISTAAQFITQEICPRVNATISNVNCNNLVVDMRTASSFSGIDMTNSIYLGTNLKYCPSEPGQITVVRVTYPLASIFPLSIYNQFVGLVNNVPNQSGWYHIVMGTALFQAEPFTNSYIQPTTC